MKAEQPLSKVESLSTSAPLDTPSSPTKRMLETGAHPESAAPKAYSIASPSVLPEENASGMSPSVSGSEPSSNQTESLNKAFASAPLLSATPATEVAAVVSVTPLKMDIDFPESDLKDATSRSAESPSPLSKHKLEEQESLTEIIAKETQLEAATTVSRIEPPTPQACESKKDLKSVEIKQQPLEQTVEMPPEAEKKVVDTLLVTKRKPDRPTPRRASLKKNERKREYVRTGNLTSGSVVFAQVKGFPFWPAMVLEPTDVPENVLPKKIGMSMLCVIFYGTYEYGFLQEKDVIPFAPNLELILSSRPARKHMEAINQAQFNPTILHDVNRKFQDNQKYVESFNQLREDEEMAPLVGEEEEEEVVEEEVEKVTSKRGRRPLPSSAASKVTDAKRTTAVASKSSSSATTSSQRCRRAASPFDKDDVTPASKRAKNRPSLSVDPTVSSRATKHSNASGAVYAKTPSPSSLAARAEASKLSNEATFNTLMRFRHILQKTFLSDKSKEHKPKASAETLYTLEWHVINSALDELSRYLKHPEFDVSLFKSTKLPKVLSLISVAKFEVVVEEKMEEHNIRSRVSDLLESIRELLAPPHPPSTVPATTTTTSQSTMSSSMRESSSAQSKASEESVIETTA